MAGIPGLENFTGVFSGSGGTIMLTLKMLLYGTFIGLGGWLAFYYLSFNIKVPIRIRTGNGFITKWKKGRFKKDKNNPGVEVFQIMGDKRWDQPLDRDYLEMEKKGFGRVALVAPFAEDAEGRLQPIRLLTKEDLLVWKGWNNNAMEFTTAKIREYAERFKKGDFWSKYGMMVQMGLFILLFVMVLVLFRQLSEINAGLSAVASAMQTAADGFNAALAQGNPNSTQLLR